MSSGFAFKTAVVLLVASACVGCFGKREMKRCHKPQEYQQAEPGPRLRVPDGMETLPADERLRLPYGERKTTPVPRGEPCLEDPPTF